MNTKFIASALIAAASFASVSAFAAGADGGIDTPLVSTVSSVSRADVRAEALAARKGPVTDSYQVEINGGSVSVQTSEVFQYQAEAGDNVCIIVTVNQGAQLGTPSSPKCVDVAG